MASAAEIPNPKTHQSSSGDEFKYKASGQRGRWTNGAGRLCVALGSLGTRQYGTDDEHSYTLRLLHSPLTVHSPTVLLLYTLFSRLSVAALFLLPVAISALYRAARFNTTSLSKYTPLRTQ